MEVALRVFSPPSADTLLMEFVPQIYAVQNARLASGSAATLEDYVTQANNLQSYADALLKEATRPLILADLTDALLAGCMKWMLDQGLSPATCNKLRAAVVAFVNFAASELGLSLRPIRTKKYRLPKRKPQCWLPDEVGRLIAAARRCEGYVGSVPARDWWPALELFILNTGTRISATMATPVTGLDLDGATVTIPAEVQKHDADEVFDLLPVTVAALRRLAPFQHDTIFGDWPYDRNVRQWPTLTRHHKRIVVAAGLRPSIEAVTRKDVFHRLRRCFATFVAVAGGKELARELMGHSHQSVTDCYIDVRMTRQRKVSELLAQVDDVLARRVTNERQPLLFD